MSNQTLSNSISQLPNSPAISNPATTPSRASVTTWIAVLAAMIGSFMAILNIQITNASLLNIEGGIGTGVDNGSWISTSYLIGEIVVIPLTDFLSRVFSFRRYMIASAALFAIFSVACAFTHDLSSMIAMRGLQGFAGGVLIPMAFTLVLTKLPKSQQPVGLAIFRRQKRPFHAHPANGRFVADCVENSLFAMVENSPSRWCASFAPMRGTTSFTAKSPAGARFGSIEPCSG